MERTKTRSKVALITGGSSGLGLAMARIVAAEEFSHVVLVARDRARLDAAADSLRRPGLEVVGFTGDVSRAVDLTKIAAELVARGLEINLLALNAGSAHAKALVDHDDLAELKNELDVNLWGTILCARLFVPLLSRDSRVLLISSGFGLVGAAGYGSYCASKAGIIAFGEALRRELLCTGARVYVACPGDIDTPQYHAELASMPRWMKEAGPRTAASPRRVMTATETATRILRRCRGGRFLIIVNADIHLLVILSKLLPRRLRDAILDRSFPRPRSTSATANPAGETACGPKIVAGRDLGPRVPGGSHHQAERLAEARRRAP